MSGLCRFGGSLAASSRAGAAASTTVQAALLRPPLLRAPPAGSRGRTDNVEGNYGRVGRSAGQAAGLQSRMPSADKHGRRIDASGAVVPAHHKALQGIAEQLAPLTSNLGSLAGGPIKAVREWNNKVSRFSERKRQEEVFEASRAFLMEPERWTYGNMAAYQRKVLELVGATGWRRRISADDSNILHLEKELKVLEAMTPSELASNHKSVFDTEAKGLVAEKAGTTVKFVEQVIMEHDILRADRRWYKIRMQFGKPLPKTFEDRQFMGEYDRPFSQAEKDYQAEMFEEQKLKMRRDKPPRLNHIWFRIPTCGGNRWSTQPPRWYPSQWKMRGERRRRLDGVGKPGGGGDRGTPWGRLAGK